MVAKIKYIPIFLLTLLICIVTTTYAQESDMDYSRETIGGVNLNSNGGLIGGIMFRRTLEVKTGRYVNFGGEIVHVKHPNEVRLQNGIQGNVFVLGKKNYLFSLRTQAGYEFVLFRKGKEDGIQVDALFNGGLSLGLLKPYYIQYFDGAQTDIIPYNENLPQSGIVGSGGFFNGFDELKIVPGFNVKSGVSFEFGAFSGGVSGIETGLLVEAFPKRMEILQISSLYPTYNRWLFSSFYVNIYFGGKR